MKKALFTPLLALPLALVWSGTAQAQDAAPKARTIYLYNASLGTAPASINAAKSGPWGNGTVSNSRRVDYEGAPVLELVTRNLQEGARFDFTSPINLDAYRDTGFLRLRLRFRDGGQGRFGGGGFPGGGFLGGGAPQSGPGAEDMRRGGGDPRMRGNFQMKPQWNGNAQFDGALPPLGGGEDPRMRGGGDTRRGGGDTRRGGGDTRRGGGDTRRGDGGGGFDPEGGAAAPVQSTNIKEIAITLLRENGVTTGRIPIDLNKTVADDNGWRLFVLPIKNMTSTPGASGAVTRAILTSDAEDTIYLAQAALVIESGEMTVSIRRPTDPAGAQIAEIEVKPGPVTLIADVEAGAADPIVEWNFDADNVGNLPPGALSSPPDTGGGEFGGTGETPGMGAPRSGPGGGEDPRMRGGDPRMRGGDPRTRGGETGAAGTIEGPRIDARGLTATFTYPNEEQNYRVEVTVTDRNGAKQPIKASILVRVRG